MRKKKKYKKPDYISKENWDNYLEAIQDFGKNLVSVMTNKIKDMNDKLKKKMPVDLELITDNEVKD